MGLTIGNSKIECGKCEHKNDVKGFNSKENKICEKCGNVLVRVK